MLYNAFQALVATTSIVAAASARLDRRVWKEISEDAARNAVGGRNGTKRVSQPCTQPLDTSCKCFGNYRCSSCTFASCSILGGKVKSVEKMSEGLTGNAWKLRLTNGPSLLLKLEYNTGAVAAAQMAHQLGVPTPPVLLVKQDDCPTLFDADQASSLNEEFGLDVKKKGRFGASLQIFVTASTDVFPGCSIETGAYRSRPWVQVGIIAMFEWLVGTTDTFIDWQESKTEDRPQNRHNILLSERLGKAVDIDLTVGRGSSVTMYLADLRSALADLTAGADVTWVRTNVMDVLHGFSLGRDEGPTQLQVQLGMTYGLRDILEQAENISKALAAVGGAAEPLQIMRQSITLEDAGVLCARSEAVLRDALSAGKHMQKCCKVQCKFDNSFKIGFIKIPRKTNCTGGTRGDGVYIVKKPSTGDDCTGYANALTHLALKNKCGPVCESGRLPALGSVSEVEMASCSDR